MLGDYTRRFPDIELIVLAGTTEFLLDALRAQHLDLAVVMKTAPQPGLTDRPLGHEEMIIVVNREHPLARQRTVEPADLASLRFILYEKNTAMQNVIDRYFEALGVTPRIAMEVENNEAIKSLVRVGLGASIMPLCAVAQEPPDSRLRVLRVKGKPLTRELRLVSADAEILPKAIQELAAALVAALSDRKGRRAPSKSIVAAD